MGHIKLTAKLVSQRMGCKVLLAAKACEPVMREASTPHYLAHGMIIPGILQGNRAVLNHYPQKGFSYLIGELVPQIRCEVSIHGMHHDIHYSAHNLVFGK